MNERVAGIGLVALAFLFVVPRPSSVVLGQRPTADSTSFYKALDLETAGKYKEAAPLFRAALRTAVAPSALLGLERVYAELGWSDSLFVPLDSLIAANPREPIYIQTVRDIGYRFEPDGCGHIDITGP